MRRWQVIAFVVLLVVIVLAFLMWAFSYTLSLRTFDVTIHVSTSRGAIRSVACYAFWDEKEVQQRTKTCLLVKPRPDEPLFAATYVEPFEGNPINVKIVSAFGGSPLGGIVRYNQHSCLLIVAYFEDGTQASKTANIPDCRVSREINVSFP